MEQPAKIERDERGADSGAAPCSAFPDIGNDPLKVRDAGDAIDAAIERLGNGVAIQQKEVPDQTMLAWRIDVDRLRCEVIWRRAAMQHKTSQRDKVIEALKAGLAVAEHCNLNCTYHKRVMNEALALLTPNESSSPTRERKP